MSPQEFRKLADTPSGARDDAYFEARHHEELYKQVMDLLLHVARGGGKATRVREVSFPLPVRNRLITEGFMVTEVIPASGFVSARFYRVSFE